MPQAWSAYRHFAALDWAREAHVVVVVHQDGTRAATIKFDHSAEGWAHLRAQLAPFGPELPIAVETNQGPAVEQLLAAGCLVFPLNPKAAVRYRERKSPSGASTDERDAWTMADALRTDGHGWRPLLPEDPLTAELRLLCRDEIGLIEQRTALLLQLQQALYDYYPAALEAFDHDLTLPAAWALIERFPTPQRLQDAGKRQWEKFLHLHKLWRPQTIEKRLAIFARAASFGATPATTAAKSLLAVSLARLLRTLEDQLTTYRQRIAELFAQHPDHDLFGSLPGAGPKLAPRLLAELGAQRERFPDAESLQLHAGTAPVPQQSGKYNRPRFRQQCQKPLRATLHLWAEQTTLRCTWAKAYYDTHRKKGHGHADTLRRLAHRWLKIVWKMWHSRAPYDEALHLQNQVKHGSWNLTLRVPAQA
jgi:transposase